MKLNQGQIRDFIVPTLADLALVSPGNKAVFCSEVQQYYRGLNDATVTGVSPFIVASPRSGWRWMAVGYADSYVAKSWDVAQVYKTNELVMRNGLLYLANAAIPANTAWAMGETGATWRPINSSGMIKDTFTKSANSASGGVAIGGTNYWMDVTGRIAMDGILTGVTCNNTTASVWMMVLRPATAVTSIQTSSTWTCIYRQQMTNGSISCAAPVKAGDHIAFWVNTGASVTFMTSIGAVATGTGTAYGSMANPLDVNSTATLGGSGMTNLIFNFGYSMTRYTESGKMVMETGSECLITGSGLWVTANQYLLRDALTIDGDTSFASLDTQNATGTHVILQPGTYIAQYSSLASGNSTVRLTVVSGTANAAQLTSCEGGVSTGGNVGMSIGTYKIVTAGVIKINLLVTGANVYGDYAWLRIRKLA